MSPRASLFLEAEPFQSAAGALNARVESGLRELGYTTERHNRARINAGDAGVPVANARRLLALRSQPPADLAVFCDMGLGIHPPTRELARRTLVYFHGLHGAPTTWLGNPLIDVYGAFSPYLHDALGALLASPDWRGRRCLDPRGPLAVQSLVPLLPCLEVEDGDDRFSSGELPPAVQEALERGEVLGHAIQPGKPDWRAIFPILLHLRALGRAHAHPPIRLVVAAQDFSTLQHALRFRSPFDPSALIAALQAADARLEDLLLPVPHLRQASLFRLFRAARFGLSYNASPESFGMYVLESVLNGCPVYTNGSGNNRHALPEGHGIFVRETAAMVSGAPEGYASFAARLFQDILAPAPAREACRRGGALIRHTFTREAFTRALRSCVARLEHAPPVPPWRFDDSTWPAAGSAPTIRTRCSTRRSRTSCASRSASPRAGWAMTRTACRCWRGSSTRGCCRSRHRRMPSLPGPPGAPGRGTPRAPAS